MKCYRIYEIQTGGNKVLLKQTGNRLEARIYLEYMQSRGKKVCMEES